MTTETPKSNPLEDALVAVIKKTTNAVETGVEFLAGQIPDVIQQLLMWHAVRSAIFFAAFVIAACTLAYVSKRLFKAWNASATSNDYGYKEEGFIMSSIMAGMLAVGSICIAFGAHMEWLQILIAPKVYLIEYAAKLVR